MISTQTLVRIFLFAIGLLIAVLGGQSSAFAAYWAGIFIGAGVASFGWRKDFIQDFNL